jgi:hypothetical protein
MESQTSEKVVFRCNRPWSPDRPRILVIACSDGRLQAQVDEFLNRHLHVVRYDRLLLPGGPGALAYSGGELGRAAEHRRECRFLVRAHRIERIVLLFHGPSDGGLEEAICADYQRKFPGITPAETRSRQEADLGHLVRFRAEWADNAQLQAFRGEVAPDRNVRFVAITGSYRSVDDSGSLR